MKLVLGLAFLLGPCGLLLAGEQIVDPATGKVLADGSAADAKEQEKAAMDAKLAAQRAEQARTLQAILDDMEKQAAAAEAKGDAASAAKLRAAIAEMKKQMEAAAAGGPAQPGPVVDGSAGVKLAAAVAPARVKLGQPIKLTVTLTSAAKVVKVPQLGPDCLADKGNPKVSFEIWHEDGKPVKRLAPASQPTVKDAPAGPAWTLVAGESDDYKKLGGPEVVLAGKLIAEEYGKPGEQYFRRPANYFVVTATGKVQLPPLDGVFTALENKQVELKGKMLAEQGGVKHMTVGWFRLAAAAAPAAGDDAAITLKKGEKHVLTDSPFFPPLSDIYAFDRPGKYTFQVRYEFDPDVTAAVRKSYRLITDPVDVEVLAPPR